MTVRRPPDERSGSVWGCVGYGDHRTGVVVGFAVLTPPYRSAGGSSWFFLIAVS